MLRVLMVCMTNPLPPWLAPASTPAHHPLLLPAPLGPSLQEITTPLGQMAYAVPALLQQHGVAEERRTPEALLEAPPKELLLPVDDIAGMCVGGGRGWGQQVWGCEVR